MKSLDFFRALNERAIDFVVVGGVAMQMQGYMRMTYDIDLVLAMNDDNLSKFIEVAKHFNLMPNIPVAIEQLKNAEQVQDWYENKGMLAFSLREQTVNGGIVDVLVRPEVQFDELSKHATDGQLFGHIVKIASIEHLLQMKRAANRPKDQFDVIALEKIQRGENPNA